MPRRAGAASNSSHDPGRDAMMDELATEAARRAVAAISATAAPAAAAPAARHAITAGGTVPIFQLATRAEIERTQYDRARAEIVQAQVNVFVLQWISHAWLS